MSAPMVRTRAWFDLPRGSVPRRVFAIGDVHGCAVELEALLSHIAPLVEAPACVVYLGDYVDRGPDPLRALDLIAAQVWPEGVEQVILRGNHDQYVLDAAGAGAKGAASTAHWLRYGGLETLHALGIDASLDVMDMAKAVRAGFGSARLSLLANSVLRHQEGDVVFAHAGLDPSVAFEAQTAAELMWVRRAFLDCPRDEWLFDALVVHGHTPARFGMDHHRVGVDSGCFSSGVLSALELYGTQGRFHQTLTTDRPSA